MLARNPFHLFDRATLDCQSRDLRLGDDPIRLHHFAAPQREHRDARNGVHPPKGTDIDFEQAALGGTQNMTMTRRNGQQTGRANRLREPLSGRLLPNVSRSELEQMNLVASFLEKERKIIGAQSVAFAEENSALIPTDVVAKNASDEILGCGVTMDRERSHVR
jgi:hypothetical protein